MTARRLAYPQVKSLDDVTALREHLEGLGVDLPVDDDVRPGGELASTLTCADGSAGDLTAPNRFVVLPMEGWDADPSGAPTDLVRRRWRRFGASGAGLVWGGEAAAVRHDGRANPNQLVVDAATAEPLASLLAELRTAADDVDVRPVVGLQLTHSGRWSRPDGPPAPRTARTDPVLDERVGAGPADVLTDGELDELVETFVDAAVVARGAGFDFVDVKACHGYLGHELLMARDRPGRYGGGLHGGARVLRRGGRGNPDLAPHPARRRRLHLY